MDKKENSSRISNLTKLMNKNSNEFNSKFQKNYMTFNSNSENNRGLLLLF